MPEQSTSETGHTKNVANFNRLIAAATGYGQRYNPANPRLRTAPLRAQHAAAEAAVKAVADALPAFKTAQNDRDALYAPLDSLATRIMGAVVAAEPGQRTEDDVRTLIRKIRG